MKKYYSELSWLGKFFWNIRFKIRWFNILNQQRKHDRDKKILIKEFLDKGLRISDSEKEIISLFGISEDDYLGNKLLDMKRYPEKWLS